MCAGDPGPGMLSTHSDELSFRLSLRILLCGGSAVGFKVHLVR